MSHIETGNTKLSLSVFVAIAEALEIQADALLYDEPRASVSHAMNEIVTILEECDAKQACIISDMVKSLKQSLDKY